MRKIVTLLLVMSSIALGMQAQDYLALEVPELEPVLLNSAEMDDNHPHLSLSTIPTQQKRTNPVGLMEPVLPTPPNYKFMDDMTFVGVPLFVAGIIAKGEKKAFRQDYNNSHSNTRLITHFKTSIDDYTQYFGPALTLGLKLGGVEGRSDWKRFLVSSAMSYGIMAALVNGIKYTATEMRPDGSTANSWPSGHTATSFVGATILHKEYGLTRSPWYSVAGYGVATATGVMRVLNNRHWVSDVLSGAGIGIFSGELAYALSDLIYKNRHLVRGDLMDVVALDREHPSFFDVSMGIGGGSKDINFDKMQYDEEDERSIPLEFGSSTVVQAEGAYFFNKYVGLGGRLRVRTSPIKGWSNLVHMADNDANEAIAFLKSIDEVSGIIGWAPLGDLIQTKEFTIESDHLTEFSGSVGLYFNVPLGNRFALGTKLLIGRSIMQALDLNARFTGMSKNMEYDVVIKNGVVDETQTYITNITEIGKSYDISWDYLEVKGSSSTSYGTGLSLTYAYRNNFCWKVFFDYDHTRKDFTLYYNPNKFVEVAMPGLLTFSRLIQESPESFEYVKSKYLNQWVLGASFSIHF